MEKVFDLEDLQSEAWYNLNSNLCACGKPFSLTRASVILTNKGSLRLYVEGSCHFGHETAIDVCITNQREGK